MEILKYIFSMSVTGSIMFLIFLLIMPLTKKNFSSSWHYKMTIIILAFFILPIGSFIKLPINTSSNLFSMKAEGYRNSDDVPKDESIENVLEKEEIVVQHHNEKIENIDSPKVKDNTYNSVDKKNKINFSGDIILYIWISGMVILFLYRIILYFRFKYTILKDSIEISHIQTIEVFNICKDKLNIKRTIPLKTYKGIGSPMLIGIFNPIVLIPILDKDIETLNMVFLHELNHYKQKDIIIKCFGFIVSTIHWFNPIIYILLNKMDIYCEYSIDEKVVGKMETGERKYYCETILKLMNNSIGRGTLTTAMSRNGKELKSRLENILFFKKNSRNKYIKSLFVLVFILISGFIVSCGIMPKNVDKNNPLIAYIKDDGLYFTYLNNGEEIKIHKGRDFIYPRISKSGSYIAYTKGESLYVFDIESREYKKITDGISSYGNSYDWVDDEIIVYANNEKGFTKLNVSTGDKIVHIDEYNYSNFKAAKDNLVYGKAMFEWTTDEGSFGFNKGITEIDLNKYDSESKKFATDIIIEGKRSTDEMIGYNPTIYKITDDGRYIFIMEKFASGSLSSDVAGIGLYDAKEKKHIDFTDIYGNEDKEDLTVLPKENNLAINPGNNDLISVIQGAGREMFLSKEVILLDINEDKTYKIINFMDKNLVAMTPSFTVDGEKLLYSATESIESQSGKEDFSLWEDWHKQPHNIYEYDLNTSKVEKVTKGNNFDFMPISLSKDTILFIRDKGNKDFSLMKISNGKEELITDNIIFGNEEVKYGFYGNAEEYKGMDILCNAKKLSLKGKKYTQKEDNMNKLYEMKGSKIGNNSAVGNILSYIEFPEELTADGIQLFTKEEPYGLQVNFKGSAMKYISMSSNEAWKSQSLILFSLIDNLDYIKYAIDDGKESIVVSNIDREYADSITVSVLGSKTSEITKNKTLFKEFYQIFGD
ncbi:M56 family metallopeptidase [Tissierella praeacuta]|uniref:M56 family metallopeptidase n=1 Tax=Tissierella praeacuta TaxID=43131 RepID=UPI00333EA4CE